MQFPLTGTIHPTTSIPLNPKPPILLPPLLSLHLNLCHVHIPADDKPLSLHTCWEQILPVHEWVSRIMGPPYKQWLSQSRWATTKQNRTTHIQTAEPPSLYLWQVGQSRLQSKVLSFPQPSFPAGLGSFFTAWQCSAKLSYTRAGTIRLQVKKKVSHINIQYKIINIRDWQWLKVERNSPSPTPVIKANTESNSYGQRGRVGLGVKEVQNK